MQVEKSTKSTKIGVNINNFSFWSVIFLSTGLIIPSIILVFAIFRPDVMIQSIWDDAFFFVRYSYNFVHQGGYSWNLDESPSFGATSQLYLVMITAIVPFLRGHEVESVVLLPPILGYLSVILMLFATRRFVVSAVIESTSFSNGKASLLTLLFASFVVGFNPKFYAHWFFGMETTTCIMVVTVLTVLTHFSAKFKGYWSLYLPVITALMFCIRPDLVLLPGPLFLLGMTKLGTPRRYSAFFGACLAALLLAVIMTGWWVYYGTPIPLPAVVKTLMSPYAHSAISVYKYGNISEFFLLARENAVNILFFSYYFFAPSKKKSFGDFGLLAGVILFSAFEMFGNKLPIAGGAGRFFMPAMPIVMWYAIRGFFESMSDRHGLAERPSLGLAALLATAVLSAPIVKVLADPLRDALKIPKMSYETALVSNGALSLKWPIIEALAEPELENCSIADSEVGLISVLPLSRKVYDLSALNNSELALGKVPADQYLLSAMPDLIWYKRIDFYWGLNLERDDRFISKYEFNANSGFAVLKTSKCATALKQKRQIDGSQSR